MPCPTFAPPSHLLAAGWLACALACAAWPAHASEAAAAHVEKPLPSPVTPAAEIVKGPQDPMEMLKKRLVATFNTAPKTAKPAEAGTNPREIAVASRLSVNAAQETEVKLSAADARPARRKASLPAVEATGRASAASPPGAAAHWSYEGNDGPAAWAAMKPEFAKCASGTRQSPIDIKDGIRVDLEPVQFDYRPTPFRVVDNGHTVQVNVGPGNWIEVTGRRYELVQFHFHRPSEERINGRQFDMVAHLVHKDLDGRLAVVAVLLDRGSAHAVVQSVWNNLPLEKREEVPARGTLNLADLLPAERAYFTYMGSLTTPPCSEGVLWMVMKQPVPISAEQIDIFARLYPMNARPLQQASGRLIKQSN